jgi:micrococcal nuclease
MHGQAADSKKLRLGGLMSKESGPGSWTQNSFRKALKHLQVFRLPLLGLFLVAAGQVQEKVDATVQRFPESVGKYVILRCHDGDTCTATRSRDSSKRTLRLLGIDAPECTYAGKQGQRWGEEAKQYLNKRVKDKKVHLDLYGYDVYGRHLAVLKDGSGRNINEELVRKGYAFAYRGRSVYKLIAAEMMIAETEARSKKRGMWALPESERPEMPTEYRRRKRQPK